MKRSCRYLGLAVLTLVAVSASAACNPFVDAEEAINKTLVRRFWEEVFNEGNVALIDEMIGDDYTLNGHPSPPAATKRWVEGLRAQNPDLKFTILDILADGDQVAVRWQLDVTGPGGTPLRNSGTNVLTIRGGKAVSNWQTGGAPGDMGPGAVTPELVRRTAFRNAVVPAPDDFESEFGVAPFRLSADFPADPPAPCDPAVCGWLVRDVSFDDPDPSWGEWAGYMQDIKSYVLEGNDVATPGWSVEVGGSTRWFHVPWQAVNPVSGREFVHGMTNERTAHLDMLVGDKGALAGAGQPAADDPGFETWAFGVYNEYGGWSLGKLIPTSGVPQFPTNVGLPFPEGTVVAKVLFTTATAADAPYLAGSPEWIIDRHVEVGGVWNPSRRALGKVRLVQLDVAVRDERSPTGWVFGTFVYDSETPGATSAVERIVPLGIQFGNDPQVQPAVTTGDAAPTQSVIQQLGIFEHLGCGGRLSGPVDSASSSCMSCHVAAYAADVPNAYSVGAIPNMIPEQACARNADGSWVDPALQAAYFTNRKYPEPYSDAYPRAQSLDYSLQLSLAYSAYDRFVQSLGPLTSGE